jgi:branched-chain amino acid transport system substrate-binding protein
MRRRKFINLFGFTTLGLVASISSCTLWSNLKKTSKLKIGVVVPLTGNLAFIGEAIKNGIELGIRKNSMQDLLQVIYEDSKGNVKDGLAAVQKLVDFDKPSVMIVNLTTVALAARPILDKAPLLAIYMSTHPYVLDSSPNGIRLFINGAQESELLAKYITENSKYRKVTVLSVADAYGDGTVRFLEPLLKSEKFDVSFQKYELTSPEFRSLAAKIKQIGTDALVIIGYGREYPMLFDNLQEQQWSGDIFGNLSFANLASQNLRNPLKKTVKYSAPGFATPEYRLKSSSEFIELYKQTFTKEPDFNAAYGFDAIQIIAKSTRKIDVSSTLPDYKSMRNSILSIENYEGAIGKIYFNSNGDSKTEMKLL